MRNMSKAASPSLWGIIILLALFSASCVPLKKQIYLQVPEDDTTRTEYVLDNTPAYVLQPGNNLYMRVISVDQELSEFFNMGFRGNNNVFQDAGIYLNSYSVNDSGFVELPYLGYFYVKGMTIKEVKEKIQEKVDEYVRNTLVVLKLVNYNVSVVGEVDRPGQYKIYQDRISIFEVLGLAGDMTVYAKRDEVMLVRKTDRGSKVHKLNLLEDNFLESEFFYIMPDDIVYVPPVKGKNFAYQSFPYPLMISTISLAIALFALFK
jgi:polysaccharide export outer membrane protein